MSLPVSSLLDVICAVHLSSYVEGPFQEHGGLMLVAPPGQMKSTTLDVLDNFPNVVTMSDVNARALIDVREQIAAKTVRTLCLPELAKIFERHSSTSSNVIGVLRAMASEGFRAASFEDSRIARLRARCTVIGAMTPSLVEEHYKKWVDTGFSRRFLWSLLRLENPEVLDKAVEDWKMIDISVRVPPTPAGSIPNDTTGEERRAIRLMVRYQPGGAHATQAALLTKILAVLRWWYTRIGAPKNAAWHTLKNFAESLGKHGTDLVVEPARDKPLRRRRPKKKVVRRSKKKVVRRRRRGGRPRYR